MSLLLPLGLLGLISLLILLLIYILKPNYQQKLISSTFVWKLSLKYKKKRIPISKLRNFLIILCQILILTAAAFILANPAKVTEYAQDYNEKIIIIDASASMLASSDGQTRFERAVDEAKEMTDEVLGNNGTVSVILAGKEASYVAQRLTADNKLLLDNRLEALACTYDKADIEGSFSLAEDVLDVNPNAEVVLLSGTRFSAVNKRVTVKNVAAEGEFNASILSVTTDTDNGYYAFTIDIACYGMDKEVELFCTVSDPNGGSVDMPLPTATVSCRNDQVFSVVYTTEVDPENHGENVVLIPLTDTMRIYSFEQILFQIKEEDSYSYDNEYYLYGGVKPEVKVLYCSTVPNNFFTGVLNQLKNNIMADKWTIDYQTQSTGDPVTEGYDLYIYEHSMPEALPTDGIVFMVDPDRSSGAGFTVGRKVQIRDWSGDGASLAAGKEHAITEGIDASAIRVTEYTQISEDSIDAGYETLMYYEGNPIFFVKNEPKAKIAVLALSVKMSTLGVSWCFPVMMSNFFEYYLPIAFDEVVYDYNDVVKLNARGEQLTVSVWDPKAEENKISVIDEFPGEYTVKQLGTYTVEQELINGTKLTQKFYVRINSEFGNITRVDDTLINPHIEEQVTRDIEDLVIWFAAIMVGLLFIEWFLQSRSGV